MRLANSEGVKINSMHFRIKHSLARLSHVAGLGPKKAQHFVTVMGQKAKKEDVEKYRKMDGSDLFTDRKVVYGRDAVTGWRKGRFLDYER